MAALLTMACGQPGGSRLEEGAATLDELGRAVWTAIVQQDTAALDRLRLSEFEHNELVWPEQDASRPEAGFPLDQAWQNIQLRNRAARTDLVHAFGDSIDRLVDTRCEGQPRRYRTFLALTDCQLVLESAGGGQRRVQAFRYVIRMDGRHKVVRYYANE